MKRFIVLSDTHGLLRPEVVGYLSQADIIIHGGDINTQAIVDNLQEYAPLYIVRGNNDKDWAERLPQSLTFSIEGVYFFLIHNKRDVPPDLSDTDVVVFSGDANTVKAQSKPYLPDDMYYALCKMLDSEFTGRYKYAGNDTVLKLSVKPKKN